MTEHPLLSAVGNIRDEFVLEADSVGLRQHQRSTRALVLKWGVAACLLFAVGVGAWRIAEMPTENPNSAIQYNTTANMILTVPAIATLPENIIVDSPITPPERFTFNNLVYRLIESYEATADDLVFEITVDEIIGGQVMKTTVYSIKGADSDTIALRFDRLDAIFFYQTEDTPAYTTAN